MSVGSTAASGSAQLDRACVAIAGVLGDGVEPGDVAVDADLFDGHPIVRGRPLDSLDLIEVVATLEDVLGRSLEPQLDDPAGPVTIRSLVAGR